MYDQVTDAAKENGSRYYACEISRDGSLLRILSDWEVLRLLNEVAVESDAALPVKKLPDGVLACCTAAIKEKLAGDDFAPHVPVFALDAALLSSCPNDNE